jgi:heme-degrading monooxygenase HmoA
MAELRRAMEGVNQLAESSPGFVWRLATPTGHAAAVEGDDRSFANLSVWESYEALHAFTYRSVHGRFARRRRRWFEPIGGPTTVLWWIPSGGTPSLEDATRRLDHLRRHGPTPRAFSLLRRFDAAGTPVWARNGASIRST